MLEKENRKFMERSIYVLTYCDAVLGAYGNKKKAYDKAKALNIDNLVSYKEVCKQLNNKKRFRSTMYLDKNYEGEYQLQLVPLNDKINV